MNRKQFIILLAFVVVLGAAGLLVHQHKNESWRGGGMAIGRKLLPNLAVNDIAQLTIKSGTGEVNLVRRDNLWRVHERGDYPANFSRISELLMKFADIKAVQSEDIGPSQLGRFELLPAGSGANTGTLLELKDQGGKTAGSVLLGKKHMSKPAGNAQFSGMADAGWADGRYVMVGAGAKTLEVISDPLDTVQPKPESWLNQDFVSIEKPRAITVQFAEATNDWRLARESETNDWQLADAKAGETLDLSKISGVTSPFSSPSFSDVAPAGAGLPARSTVLTVETFEGFNYVAKIGSKAGENYPVSFSITAKLPAARTPAKDEQAGDKARRDAEFKELQGRLNEKISREAAFTNWIYQMPAYLVDPLLKPRQQLLAEAKKEESPKSEK